jgi:hypothetical protein
MLDDCPMTEDCPGYDRDQRVCLLRPGDCEFAPADRDAVLTVEMPKALMPDAMGGTRRPHRASIGGYER